MGNTYSVSLTDSRGRDRSAHRAPAMLGFLTEFLRAPVRTGAVLPSSRAVVTAVLGSADFSGSRCVVELGAGSGAITEVLAQRLTPPTRLLAIELNPVLAARLRACDLGTQVDVVTGSAEALPDVLAERGITEVDHVISGLPWTCLSEPVRNNIIAAVAAALGDTGEFRTLLCAHTVQSRAGRDFQQLLRQRFLAVRHGDTIWANLPPLRLLHCSRPSQHRETDH